MPRVASAAFIDKTHSEATERIILLRVAISSTPEVSGEEDLYLTNQTEPVDYYETNAGVHTARSYQPFPFAYESISSNAEGDIDEAVLSISNVSREIEAFIEQRDGLRGRTVIIREVFRDALSDPTSHIEEVFTVESVDSDANVASFKLSTGLNVQHIQVPKRRYFRMCSHVYKGKGCWINNGDGTFTEPSGFSVVDQPLILSEFRDKGNSLSARSRFRAIIAAGLDLATDSIKLDLKKDAGGTVTATSYLRISSERDGATNYIQLSDISGLTIGTGYATNTIPLSGFSESGTFDKNNIQYVELNVSGGTSALKLYVKNVKLVIVDPAPWTDGDEDFCRYTLPDCIRHQNTARFGGFPSVPGRNQFRI